MNDGRRKARKNVKEEPRLVGLSDCGEGRPDVEE